MKKIEDVSIGDVKILNHGNNISFELTSIYNQGEIIGKILCKNVKFIYIKNAYFGIEEGFEGCFIPLIQIKNISDIFEEKEFETYEDQSNNKIKGYEMTFIGSSLHCKIICYDVEFNFAKKFNHIINEMSEDS
ncbi:hypothetical protein [Snodgrassella alvi]|uniref:hypothetical protein n=1 Tax=Snodgrassella alvi TaxID=1196083 RepID=UPI00351594A8